MLRVIEQVSGAVDFDFSKWIENLDWVVTGPRYPFMWQGHLAGVA